MLWICWVCEQLLASQEVLMERVSEWIKRLANSLWWPEFYEFNDLWVRFPETRSLCELVMVLPIHVGCSQMKSNKMPSLQQRPTGLSVWEYSLVHVFTVTSMHIPEEATSILAWDMKSFQTGNYFNLGIRSFDTVLMWIVTLLTNRSWLHLHGRFLCFLLFSLPAAYVQ
jgi:hypothetical protein